MLVSVIHNDTNSLHCYTDHLCCYWFMVYQAERAFISRSPRVALPRNSQIALTYTCSFPNFLSPHQQSHVRFPSLASHSFHYHTTLSPQRTTHNAQRAFIHFCQQEHCSHARYRRSRW